MNLIKALVLSIVVAIVTFYIGKTFIYPQQLPTKVIAYDTITKDTGKTKFYPEYIDTTIYSTILLHDTVHTKIDTYAILVDYFAKKFYVDTTIVDSLLTVIIEDSITKNSIVYRHIKTRYINKTTTIYPTTQLKGLFIGGNLWFNTIGLNASYINNNNCFDLSFNLSNFNNNIIYYPTIGFKRKLQW